jgi:hypothetical protein
MNTPTPSPPVAVIVWSESTTTSIGETFPDVVGSELPVELSPEGFGSDDVRFRGGSSSKRQPMKPALENASTQRATAEEDFITVIGSLPPSEGPATSNGGRRSA